MLNLLKTLTILTLFSFAFISSHEVSANDLSDSSCSMTFTYDQTGCNTTSNDCAEVELLVQNLYSFPCGSNVTDIDWTFDPGVVVCGGGPWSGVSPTYTVDIDVVATSINKGVGSSNIPVGVTMTYTYNCSGGTCTDSYYRTIYLFVC